MEWGLVTRPGCPGRSGHWLVTAIVAVWSRGRRQNASGRRSWPPGSSAGLPGRVHQDQRLLSDLGGGHADGTWDGRLRHYLLAALLILDDFALREYTIQQADDLYELISDRTRAG